MHNPKVKEIRYQSFRMTTFLKKNENINFLCYDFPTLDLTFIETVCLY